jgi:hypothetical protein
MLRKLTIALTSFALASCSDTPTGESARGAFRSKISTSVQNAPFEILSFQKSNGQAADVMGVRAYRYFYSASVSFPEGYRPECVEQGSRFTGFDCGFLAAKQNVVGPQKKGTIANYTGIINFQDTENGWVHDNVTVTEQSRMITDDETPTRLSTDPAFLSGRNWGPEGGYFLIFETSSAATKQTASNITAYWGDFLDRAGVRSYKLEWHPPNRLMLCVQQNADSHGTKRSVMQNSPGAGDLRVVAEMTFQGGDCNYAKITGQQ